MQKALIVVLHLMLGNGGGLLTEVWMKVRAGEMRIALAGAVLLSSAACVEAQAMSGAQLRCSGLRTMGREEEVLQPVRLFGRLVFGPEHAVGAGHAGWTVGLLART